MSAQPQDTAPATPNGKRRRALLILATLFTLLASGGGYYWFYYGRWQVTTDNAYVGGNVVQITPQIAGTVVRVLADDRPHGVKRLQPRPGEVPRHRTIMPG
jgi:membrane fusion protein (multidrug efflux system)